MLNFECSSLLETIKNGTPWFAGLEIRPNCKSCLSSIPPAFHFVHFVRSSSNSSNVTKRSPVYTQFSPWTGRGWFCLDRQVRLMSNRCEKNPGNRSSTCTAQVRFLELFPQRVQSLPCARCPIVSLTFNEDKCLLHGVNLNHMDLRLWVPGAANFIPYHA